LGHLRPQRFRGNSFAEKGGQFVPLAQKQMLYLSPTVLKKGALEESCAETSQFP
jgi:hypothetical protein